VGGGVAIENVAMDLRGLDLLPLRRNNSISRLVTHSVRGDAQRDGLHGGRRLMRTISMVVVHIIPGVRSGQRRERLMCPVDSVF
jgi:hypothetical protein